MRAPAIDWAVPQYCAHCWVRLRPQKTRPTPGMRLISGRGLCTSCYTLARRIGRPRPETHWQYLRRMEITAPHITPTVSPEWTGITPLRKDTTHGTGTEGNR